MQAIDRWVIAWWDNSIGEAHEELKLALTEHVAETYDGDVYCTFDGEVLSATIVMDDGAAMLAWRLYEDGSDDDGERIAS